MKKTFQIILVACLTLMVAGCAKKPSVEGTWKSTFANNSTYNMIFEQAFGEGCTVSGDDKYVLSKDNSFTEKGTMTISLPNIPDLPGVSFTATLSISQSGDYMAAKDDKGKVNGLTFTITSSNTTVTDVNVSGYIDETSRQQIIANANSVLAEMAKSIDQESIKTPDVYTVTSLTETTMELKDKDGMSTTYTKH